jgi:hypothetical protein
MALSSATPGGKPAASGQAASEAIESQVGTQVVRRHMIDQTNSVQHGSMHHLTGDKGVADVAADAAAKRV